jgi:hypothetical protein
MGISGRVMQKWLSLLEVAELPPRGWDGHKWQSYAELEELCSSG